MVIALMRVHVYTFESQKVAFSQPPAAHARALSNLTEPASACLNFEP